MWKSGGTFEVRYSKQTRKATTSEVVSCGIVGTGCHDIKQQLKSFKLNEFKKIIFGIFPTLKS